MEHSYPQKKGSLTIWHWVFFSLLQAFCFYQIMKHAMWRDELQIWSVVRESHSPVELFHNMRYDGFPSLWYICLWLISLFTSSPLAMQLFHFVCSVLTQLVVMIRAPFSGHMKLAIVGGYFLSFEYCIISRAYILGVLLVFFFCGWQPWLDRHPAAKGGLIGLLANTSLYGAMLSLVFAADETYAALGRRKEGAAGESRGAFFIVYLVLFVIAVAFMAPPADGMYHPGWRLDLDINAAIYLLCRNFLLFIPVPVPQVDFWNTQLVVDAPWAARWMVIPGAIVVASAVFLSLRKSPRHLALFLVGFAGIWIFSVVKFYGYVRHIGTAYILLVACIWLANSRSKESVTSRSATIAVWLMLWGNVVAWGIASYYHIRYDFSGAREMAAYIESANLRHLPVVADSDKAASAVAGYLNKPLYYTANRKLQTFIRWNSERVAEGPESTLQFADEIAAKTGGKVLLLLNYPLNGVPVRFLARTSEGIVADEVFYLYEYRP